MPLDLADVAAHRLPSPDLATILVGQTAAHVIATIPLEPAARIVGMQPSFATPDRERLAGVDAEVVERAVAAAVGKLGGGKPAVRKFALGVGHVFAAEDAEREHLLGRQLRSKFGIEIAARRLRDPVAVALLHLVVDDDGFLACRPIHLVPSAARSVTAYAHGGPAVASASARSYAATRSRAVHQMRPSSIRISRMTMTSPSPPPP